MKAILGIPEIVIMVFQRCDGLHDAVALASTCKAAASIWRLHSSSIIWPLAKAAIPGFSQALMAARATALVCDAFEANELPPHPFPLNELSGDTRKPDLDDLKRVLDLRHLVRCVEQMYRDWDCGLNREIPGPTSEWSDPDDWAAMRDRFHLSMYRVLLAGAALTRPYMEPLLAAPTEGPPGLLHRRRHLDWDPYDMSMSAEDLEDLEYLERFPAYRLEATLEEWEPVFGDLAQWLVDDAKSTAAHFERGPRRPLEHLTPDDRGCLQEILWFLAAYEHMMDKFFNQYIKDADDENLEERDLVPPPFPGHVRDVSTAMFGMFRPEKVSMPAKVEDASRSSLVNFPLGHYPRDNSVLPKVTPWNTDVRALLLWTQHNGSRPNCRDDRPSPPPWLRFVEFVTRKFFHVGFKNRLFDVEGRYYMEDYQVRFLSCSDLFGDWFSRYWSGECVVLAPYQSPVLSYRCHV